MKKVRFMLFVIILFVISIPDVNADFKYPNSSTSPEIFDNFNQLGNVSSKITEKDYVLECIYSDGSLFTFEYSQAKNNFQHNKSIYNVVGSSHQDSATEALVFVNNMPSLYGNYGSINYYSYSGYPLTCANKVYSTSYGGATYYKFRTNFTPCTDEVCPDLNANRGGWCAFWGCGASYIEAKEAQKNAVSASLVSERYILNYDYPTPKNTYYYVLYSEQAAGVNAYIKFLVYDNVILLEKDGRVTEIRSSSSAIYNSLIELPKGADPSYKEIYINSPEPISVATSNSSFAYKFNDIKYKVSAVNQQGYTKYVYTKTIPSSNEISDGLCTEKLKNTSPILKNIIGYSQIIIPAIVLIVTGIDIGKIVLAGNIEEELPKRKKNIVIRLIIMLIFFFLPLFVRLFISLIKESGIGKDNSIGSKIEYIDCLFK